MSAAATAAGPTGTVNVDDKVMKDLGTLTEKMDLCEAMLNPTTGTAASVKTSEAMLAVVGFLEACAPRMVELVEAAAQGALSEETFAHCLSANDRLQKLLSDVEKAAQSETNVSTTAAAAPDVSSEVKDQFEDLLLDDDGGTMLPTGGKSTGEEDSKPSSTAAPDAQQPTSNDPFDDFISDRVKDDAL